MHAKPCCPFAPVCLFLASAKFCVRAVSLAEHSIALRTALRARPAFGMVPCGLAVWLIFRLSEEALVVPLS